MLYFISANNKKNYSFKLKSNGFKIHMLPSQQFHGAGKICDLCDLLGPVHTSAFSNVCVFVRPRTHRLIRVHTTVFAAFSTVHTNTLENDVWSSC